MAYGMQPMPLAARNPLQAGRGMVGKPAVGGGAPGLPERDTATLDLDFTKGFLDPRLTFTRASAGSQMGARGLIESVPTDKPRFNHDPVTGKCLGLLVEEQRTNVCLYSQDISNVAWNTTSDTSYATDSAVAPDGTTTADTLTATSSNGLRQQDVTTTAIAWNFSVYLLRKTGTGDVQITMDGTTFVTQTINSTTWTSCTVLQTGVAGTSKPGIRLVTSGDEVYVWGAQAEAGNFPSSYIPTTSASAVRYGDLVVMIGTKRKYLSWFNPLGGTLFVDVMFVNATNTGLNEKIVTIGDGTFSTNTINIEHCTSTIGYIRGLASSVAWSGAYSASIEFFSPVVAGTWYRAVYSMVGRFRTGAVNGTRLAGGIFLYAPLLIAKKLNIGSAGNDAVFMNGTIARVIYRPFGKTAQQCRRMTL